MNRSIEQALLSLLPTHNSVLPQPLTDLASSLLAQSRHRASTLKAEEEIARPYACAHIACDRLKITLNLPPIEPRPPIQPRIYKRLYSHLDKILPTAASASTPGRTPSSKLRNNDPNLLGTSPLSHKTRPTPSKEKSLADFRGTPSGTPSKRGRQSASSRQGPILPRWIRPTLRFLCSELGPTDIGPVVASGIESIILTPGGQKLTQDEWVLANPVSVLGALYLYVWRGVTWPGEDMDKTMYAKFRKEVAETLSRAREQVQVDGPEEEAWEGWHEVNAKSLDNATLRINRHGWLEMDWARGVQDLVQRERDRAEEEGDVQEVQEEVKIRRADTMFQDRYDYLTEKKRKAYSQWKEGIVKRIKALEKDE
ncbi:origin recognition complex, subunit 6 [Podospora fimiseda]|uniref:Origin recognition complex, subunit 6 n=1 Tax=Podospora fimiseda TaxID=252190 RepID=A0AAN7BSK4_9PEZI|nr:origin recognition complex, subunit 6 [Podospora fimiseda]